METDLFESIVPSLCILPDEVNHNIGFTDAILDKLFISDAEVFKRYDVAQVTHGTKMLHVQIITPVGADCTPTFLSDQADNVSAQESSSAEDSGHNATNRLPSS